MEPFFALFRFGIVMGILFLGIWPVYSFLKLIPYPGAIHVQGVTSLFIGSFAVGFLLTALPRFTSTTPTKKITVRYFLFLSALECLLLLGQEFQWSALLSALKFLSLLIFAIPRVKNKKFPLPSSFVWVGMALLQGVAGGIGLFFLEGTWSRNFLHRGLLTGLFIGIGGKLVPILTGISGEAFSPVGSKKESMQHGFLASIFTLALFFENSQWTQLCLTIETLVLSVELLFFWRLYRLPVGDARPVLLWLASWCLILGTGLSTLFPIYRMHLMHFVFGGTFLLGTITVASHVTVAHLSLNPELLRNFKPLGLVGALLIIAVITRVLAPVVSYERHLGYAGLLASLSLIYWGLRFLGGKHETLST